MHDGRPHQAIIFDFDDTLVGTSRVKWAHHKAVAQEFYGRTLTDETLAKHWGMPFDPMIQLFHDRTDVDSMHAAYRASEHRFLKTIQPDALTAINHLTRAGYKLGILSAMNSDAVMVDLDRLGFPSDRFLFVQGAEATSVHKPDPGVFTPALAHLDQLGIKPAEVLYVGDALSDFYAASNAGIGFIGVTTGLVSSSQFAAAYAQSVPSLTALVELIMSTEQPSRANDAPA